MAANLCYYMMQIGTTLSIFNLLYKNDVIENMISDVDKNLFAESRDAMVNEAVERFC